MTNISNGCGSARLYDLLAIITRTEYGIRRSTSVNLSVGGFVDLDEAFRPPVFKGADVAQVLKTWVLLHVRKYITIQMCRYRPP